MDKPLFDIESDQKEHPDIEDVEGYEEGNYGLGNIHLIPESSLPDNIRDYSREFISNSLDFLEEFEGPGFIVHGFRTENGYITADFDAEFKWKEDIKSEAREIYGISRDVADVDPLIEWYFNSQTPTLSIYQNRQEPIFFDPKIHGIEALMYEGDSDVRLLHYDKIIEVWGNETDKEKQFTGADLAGQYAEDQELKDVEMPDNIEFEIKDFPEKESELIDSLKRELRQHGFNVKKSEKHPPVITS